MMMTMANIGGQKSHRMNIHGLGEAPLWICLYA